MWSGLEHGRITTALLPRLGTKKDESGRRSVRPRQVSAVDHLGAALGSALGSAAAPPPAPPSVAPPPAPPSGAGSGAGSGSAVGAPSSVGSSASFFPPLQATR